MRISPAWLSLLLFGCSPDDAPGPPPRDLSSKIDDLGVPPQSDLSARIDDLSVPENDLASSDLATQTNVDLALEDGSAPADLADVVLFTENFEQLPLGTNWVNGMSYGNWTLIDNGGGSAGIEVDRTQVL